MRRSRRTFATLSTLAALALPLAAQEVRLGAEFQVNTYTTQAQSRPGVAVEGDGDFVVVWQSYLQDGASQGVFARRFTSAGAASGAELQVNAYTTSYQRSPAVAPGGGGFVVTWHSFGQDGSDDGVFARRFSSGGSALGAELQVNNYTSGAQRYPSVAADGDGDFVVAWASVGQDGGNYGVFARRFSSAGSALGAELQVNAYTASVQRSPSVAVEPDGDFVVAWNSVGQDGPEYGVFARRFSSAGLAQGAELQVNTFTIDNQRSPSVATAADGDFVVAWTSNTQDGSSYGVFGRRFRSTGAADGAEFQVNTRTQGSQDARVSVAASASGDFVITWESYDQDGDDNGVFARRFSSAGVGQGVEFQVAAFTANAQNAPSVAADADGDFVVAWESFGEDGSSYGVFAQRFADPVALDVDGNGSAQPLTDGLLALRYLFGFRGATLVTGAVDVVGCTRCNAPAIEAYLAELSD